MRIYFDHAATSSVRSEVKNFLSDKGNLEFFNPSSVHAEGQSSRSKINNARDIIASLIKSDPDNILLEFTIFFKFPFLSKTLQL